MRDGRARHRLQTSLAAAIVPSPGGTSADQRLAGCWVQALGELPAQNAAGGDSSDGTRVDGGESVEDVENVEGNADARVTVAANGVNVMVDKNWHISLGQSILEAVTVATLVDMNLSSGASTRVPDENVVHMDSAFVESLGRQQTQKTVDKDALRRPAWCAQSSSFEPYSGGYQQRTPLHRRVRSKPLLFLP
ncbi:hypothetical protein PC110_g7182 [Phytophthora cactorum]|uniref:Uncharacterized protein n=1 Tax=Phytophthora cactorum TaxID=29920 RepID=A0A329SIC0_9STRA|nr:hypothetical protein PC110_g7182 [Phytophthora cactorum]